MHQGRSFLLFPESHRRYLPSSTSGPTFKTHSHKHQLETSESRSRSASGHLNTDDSVDSPSKDEDTIMTSHVATLQLPSHLTPAFAGIPGSGLKYKRSLNESPGGRLDGTKRRKIHSFDADDSTDEENSVDGEESAENKVLLEVEGSADEEGNFVDEGNLADEENSDDEKNFDDEKNSIDSNTTEEIDIAEVEDSADEDDAMEYVTD